jgi:glutamate synthase domain-containing protein 2
MQIAKRLVNVKLVAEVGVGTIAAGVAKASRCDFNFCWLTEEQVLHH